MQDMSLGPRKGRAMSIEGEDEKQLAKKEDARVSKKEWRASKIGNTFRIVGFRGAVMMLEDGEWVDLSSQRFARAAYSVLGNGTPRNAVADLEHLFRSNPPQDLSHMEHYIAFQGQDSLVWDMKKVDWTTDVPAEDCVYRVPAIPQATKDSKIVDKNGRMRFIMDLACGDEGLYDDIMQTIAPLFTWKKPTGVIWYLGSGANGKSTLVHLIYLLLAPHLTEITVKQLEDERDTPQLNGKLGNICKESSEGYIEDSRTYKSIGTHESFLVHKFHSQDMVEINGNIHHIFSANNIPTFGDKSFGARRRTLVIPFNNTFPPDEQFEDRTFTPEFVDHFLYEVLKYAKRMKEQNYEYKFHEVTRGMKEKYDTDANTALTYAEELIAEDILGFSSYKNLYDDYHNWCLDNGYQEYKIQAFRKAVGDAGFDRKAARDSAGNPKQMYLYKDTSYTDLELVGGIRPGLWRKEGSEHKTPTILTDEHKQEQVEMW